MEACSNVETEPFRPVAEERLMRISIKSALPVIGVFLLTVDGLIWLRGLRAQQTSGAQSSAQQGQVNDTPGSANATTTIGGQQLPPPPPNSAA
jgi:hypothetical protein